MLISSLTFAPQVVEKDQQRRESGLAHIFDDLRQRK